MTLVDSSIWIDHLRGHDPVMAALLEVGDVLIHPFVIGELVLGRLPHPLILHELNKLPRATVAADDEVLMLIERNVLVGSGIGYVDAHLLAAARLGDGVRLWTRDKQLRVVAERLDISANPLH